MKNIVKELLAKQENERLELGKKVVSEINKLINMLKELGCEHLLSLKAGETKEIVKEVEVVKEVIVEVPVEVVKEVEVIKEVTVDNSELQNEIEKLKEEIKKKNIENGNLKGQVTKAKNNKEAMQNKIKELEDEIVKLGKEVSKYKTTASTWHSKYDELKNTITVEEPVEITDTVAESEDKITNEKEDSKEVTKNNTKKRNTRQNKRKREAVKNNAEQQDNKIEKEVVAENQIIKTDDVSLMECKSYRRSREDVHMYEGKQCYVLASEICQQITVIPKAHSFVVTDELVDAYQQELVNKGYAPVRTNVSPVVINHSEGIYKGYLARTDALEGVETFSKDDVFAGYVYKGSKGYLFTWDRSKHSVPAMYKLQESVQGRKDANSITSKEIAEMSIFVKKMFKLYDAKVEVIVAKATEIAKQKAEIARQKLEVNSQETKRIREKMNAAKESGRVLGSSTTTKTKRGIKRKNNASDLSSSLQNAAKGF